TPDLGHARGAADGRSHPVLVVDANEHDREVPELGHDERLVEGTDVGGAVPEYAHHDLVALLVVDSVATAHSERERLADDGVAAVEAVLLAEQMHGPAPAVRGAGFLPKKLRHHRLRVDPFGDRVPVLAIVAVDVILRPERRDGPHDGRLFPDIQMAEAADL